MNIMMEPFQKVKHVVVDSGAFIKNANIQMVGESIYTLSDVVAEIRDQATRERLQVLPYTLQFREPPAEAIKFVTEFAKKTGDYRSLSATDLKVIALTYQLQKEWVGTENIRQQPQKKGELITARKLLDNPAEIAGFYLDKKGDKQKTLTIDSASNTGKEEDFHSSTEIASGLSSSTVRASNTDKDTVKAEKADIVLESLQQLGLEDTKHAHGKCQSSEAQGSSDSSTEARTVDQTTDINKNGLSGSGGDVNVGDGLESHWLAEGETLSVDLLESESEEESEHTDEEESDEEGWITPKNIKAMKERLGDVNTEKASVTVACLTTDFSMQNVIIQMGLNVISVNGMLIKRAKSYVLRCFACMKITSNVSKQFCPHCGNHTLQRVSMTVEQDGSVRYFLSSRKPVSTKGLKFSLPAPRGGKHGNNPILCEDQPRPQQREAKKAQHSLNVFDPDYIANQSPFSLNDTTSRAAQLGIRHKGAWNKRNPNVGKKKSGRRK